ncbi:hypothetical protein F5887DRAFT_961146 [Amanita rubescens]|nr:hypothetical protein F5887DRAFT_961146 [Amanita rubescens]
MQITFFLLFLPCFLITFADILLASPLTSRDLPGQNSVSLRPRLRRRSSRLIARGKDPVLTFEGCSEPEEGLNFLKTSRSNAPRYTTWFGHDKDGVNKKTVQTILTNSRKSLDKDTLYDCHTCDRHDTAARVDPAVRGRVNLCPPFWAAPRDGQNSKSGYLIHEMTHFEGTKDYANSEPAAEHLASTNPAMAIKNAYSYQFFVEYNLPGHY